MSDSDDFEELTGSAAEEEEEEIAEREEGTREKAREHVQQLQRLKEKDPDFYQYLKECGKELLEFDDDQDNDEDQGTDLDEDEKPRSIPDEESKQRAKPITMEMVDSWCKAIQDGKIGPVHSLLRAFRTACHYGDDEGDNSVSKFSVMSSGVFNRVMVFVLNEMDGILRQALDAPSSGGKKETILELMTTKQWKRHGRLMRVYLGNALHIITEMTDEQMIAFTLRRVKASAVFLTAFPSLLRKYIKVLLHTWGRGRGAMPVVSFLFLRDLCIRLGSDCLDPCLKGVYKAYLVNCKLSKSVSGSKLQHLQFLGNCVAELYGVDPPTAYQHAFVFIRQLAVILRGALTERGPKAVKDKKDKKQKESNKPTTKQMEKTYQKVYDWQYIFCLELWTGVVCTYSSEEDFRPLAYPLSQIIHGVACLVPTVRYFPLRLRCVKMLNRIAKATGTFIPVSALLLDMLEMKELRGPPAAGVGKAVNLLNVKQVDKTTIKTRSFQEACIYSVVEELANHLVQWSYSIAFFEMSFLPLVRLRSFCKTLKADRFRREIKDLIHQLEANVEFVNTKRVGIGFSPNDPAAELFLKAEKEEGCSPLSRYVATLHERAQNRKDAMSETSVLVGGESSVFVRKLSEIRDGDDEQDDEEGAAVFNSDWLPEKKKPKVAKEKKSKKRSHGSDGDVATDEDLVEDLILSSDEENENDDEEQAEDDSFPVEDDSDADYTDPNNERKKQRAKSKKRNMGKQSSKASSKKRRRPRPKKAAKN